MGYDAYARCAVGVPMTRHKVWKELTRYDQITGKPYQIKDEVDEYRVAGMVIDPSSWDEEKRERLIHRKSSFTDEGIIGLAVHRKTTHDDPHYALLDNVSQLPSREEMEVLAEQAKRELAELGYSGPVQFYIIKYESY